MSTTHIQQATEIAQRIADAIASSDFSRVWEERGWAIDFFRRMEAAGEKTAADTVREALKAVDAFRARRVAAELKGFLKDGEAALMDESESDLERVAAARAACYEAKEALRQIREDFFLRRTLMALWGIQGKDVLKRKEESFRLLEAGIDSLVASSPAIRKISWELNCRWKAAIANGNVAAAEVATRELESLVGPRPDVWKEIEAAAAAKSREGCRK